MTEEINLQGSSYDTVREHYDTAFDSKFYLNQFYTDMHPVEELSLRKLHNYFTQGSLKGPIDRCIDIGCGPTVYRLSAASKICGTLVYADFSSRNIKFVKEWLKDTISDHALENKFQFCAELEGFQDPVKGGIEIQNRIKSKSPDVIQINILEPQSVAEFDQPFDVAFSAACLESACDTFQSYVRGVKNMATLIRAEGYLILKGYLGCSFYVVNGITFPNITLSEDMVKKALEEGGFKVLEFEVIVHSRVKQVAAYNEKSDCKGSFCALAQKL